MEDNRKRARSDDSYRHPSKRRHEEGIGPVVAKHYNELEEKGVEARSLSQIYYMRNFNNWIKSTLINDVIKLYPDRPRNSLTVLDMCCGKGGDIQKWIKSSAVRHVIFADIAETSVGQCEERYKHASRFQNRNMFTAEFITADCSKERLRLKYESPGIAVDLVSVQFGFHYSFESIEQVEMMLQNISENLKFGGYFVGTMPNSNRIVRQYREAGSKEFGNGTYTIRFDCAEPLPLFGAKYFFQLDEVVNCPEFLVYFPCLEQMAAKYNLKLVFKRDFDDYFYKKKAEGEFLLNKMQALQMYPPNEEERDLEYGPHEFDHAVKFLEDHPEYNSVGTLVKSQWQAISLYSVFCFEKVLPKKS